MKGKKNASRAKLNAASQEERLKKWKEHNNNLLGNPLEIENKPTRQLTKEEFYAPLRKLTAKNCRPRQNAA